MSDHPPEVEEFHAALRRLSAVLDVNTGLKSLDEFPPDVYSLPGELGDLPHALLRRTNGGLPGEAWAHTEVVLAPTADGWLALEFLAWWVRDCSRGGEQIQLRPMALPPRGFEKQLGSTLKLIVDQFETCPDDPSPMLRALRSRADSLNSAIDDYANELGQAAT